MIRSDARDASVLARAELRARVRHTLGNARQLVGIGVLSLVFGVAVPLMALGTATGYGGRLASAAPVGDTGAVVGTVGAVGLYLGSATAIQQNRLGSVGSLVRTAVPPRAVVIGRVASETFQGSLFVIVPGAVLLGLVGLGAGGPLAPFLLALAVVPVLLAATFLGRVAGDLLRLANRWLRIGTWAKAALLLAGVGVAFVGSQAVTKSVLAPSEGVVVPSAFLPGEPLQAYAGVALAPLGSGVGPVGLGTAALVLAAVPASLAATLRVERRLLLSEPPGERDETANADESREVPGPFRATSSARVAWRYLLRTRRDPAMLAHLFPVVIGGLSFATSFVGDPEFALSVGPGAAVVGGTALSGGAYCLNPLGDDRDQLPLILSSARSTAVMLRGRALAGLVVGLVVAWGVAVPLSLATGSVTAAVGHAVFALFLLAAGTGTALGMGALLPKFERREYVNVERAHPSMVVTMGYLLGTMVVGVVGLLVLAGVLGDPSVVHWGVAAVFAVVVGATGLGGYLYAVRRFDRLSLDDV